MYRTYGSREPDKVIMNQLFNQPFYRFREKEGFELMEKCLKENKIAAGNEFWLSLILLRIGCEGHQLRYFKQ